MEKMEKRSHSDFRDRSSVSHLLAWAAWSIVAVGTGGCSKSSPLPSELADLAPVSGRVSFEGKPTPGAAVEFIPANGDPSARNPVVGAIVKEDGSFKLKSVAKQTSREGAPPGEYVVTVSWTPPLNPKDRESDLSPEMLPGKYQDPKESGLRYTVKSGKNEIPPIELTP